MNVRIISGKFGGRTIQAPGGNGLTHPMGDRVRGSLFNIINDNLDGVDVLDVFAGTGALGLEALSRGAKSATFIERDRVASKILAENIDYLGVQSQTTSIQIGASTWIGKNLDNRYDIIFIDPPYNDMQFSVVAKLIGLLRPNGTMVLSYPEKVEVPVFDGVIQVDDRNYGGANLRFYRRG